MFIEKELDKDSSPFQKDHVYILRGIVNAERYTLAGTVGMLAGTEGGMVMRLADIKDDGRHVFQEMLYIRDKCQIDLDGYCGAYAVESRDLNINDFEDITDDADFAELLRSMKENEKEAEPWMKRVDIKGMLVEKAIAIIALLLLVMIFLIGLYVFICVINNLHNPEATGLPLMICGGIIVSLIFGIATIVVPWFLLSDSRFLLWIKIEKIVNKKDHAILETIYKKNDALLQAFEQKKHLERS